MYQPCATYSFDDCMENIKKKESPIVNLIELKGKGWKEKGDREKEKGSEAEQ